jgi:hypothetical protein
MRLHPLLGSMYYGLITLCAVYGVFWVWLIVHSSGVGH